MKRDCRYLILILLFTGLPPALDAQAEMLEQARSNVQATLETTREVIRQAPQPRVQEGTTAEPVGSTVQVITVTGVISPISADFIARSIEDAEEERAQCIIIELDTPGGLGEAKRTRGRP